MSVFEPSGDGCILERFGLDDLDVTSVRQYREMFAVTKPQDQWPALDEAALLEQLRCCTPAAPRYFVDFRDCRGLHRAAQKWSDRLFPTEHGKQPFSVSPPQLKLTSDLNAVLRASKASQTINAT